MTAADTVLDQIFHITQYTASWHGQDAPIPTLESHKLADLITELGENRAKQNLTDTQ